MPSKYLLYSAFPNPFNNTTTICLDLPEDSYLELSIYDIDGHEIWNYNNCKSCKYPAGYYSVDWDGNNKYGEIVPTGIYFVTMKTPSYLKTVKILFVK